MATKMTAEQAKQFETYSAANAGLATMGKECKCEPYVDIFTLRRWNAQGFKIKKGEKGSYVTTYVTHEKIDEEGNSHKTRQIHGTVLFCRCQVEPFK